MIRQPALPRFYDVVDYNARTVCKGSKIISRQLRPPADIHNEFLLFTNN